jgi:BirA family biotin operon repressor/biotin-[acetyl-CoA-carboxylase] ligase
LENQRNRSEELRLQELLTNHTFEKLNPIGPVILESVESTQDFVHDQSGAKEEGYLVISKVQTKGRGREGRSWASDEGGLWMTLVLKPPIPQILGKLPLIATQSIVTTLEEFGLSSCSVKPPNDVYCSGKKIAGVLVDATVEGNNSVALLGIGINVNNDPYKNESISQIATSYFVETRRSLDLVTFAFRLLATIDAVYSGAISKEK